MAAATTVAPTIGIVSTCRALGLARASFYRQVRPPAVSPRSLDPAERQMVLDVLHAPRFQDRSRPEVDATLLDEGDYRASERTFDCHLAAAGETRERRTQLVHAPDHKPELLRFNCIEDAQAFSQDEVPIKSRWSNTENRHVGIGLTPSEAGHNGRAPELDAVQAAVLRAAYTAHPDRFVNHVPRPPTLPTAALVNPPKPTMTEKMSQ